ncbi:MAG TPA: SIMPL domain-containing protein [Pseudobdellovibrionaceae bacterium]|nr:SIMPL domain-containing protein [Pseudobdellovibrionaceae bacterium]
MRGNLLIAIGIVLAGFLVSRAIVTFKEMDRAVEVRGLAERIVDADQAAWTLRYSASSEQLADVNAKIQAIQDRVIEFVKQQGFSEEEIQKDVMNITDKTTQEYGDSKGPRFVARGGVMVGTKRVREVTTASQKTDELLKKGIVLSSSNVSYYFTDLNAIKPAMLEEATKSAREAAQVFAQHADAKVGGIKRATQGLFSINSPLEDYDNSTSVKKKVRVVTQVVFYLE